MSALSAILPSMKTLFLILLSVFSLASVTQAKEHKRVSIQKVIKAIKKDPEKALKDYALFTSRFAVIKTKAVTPKPEEMPSPVLNIEGYQGFVKGTSQTVISKGVHKDDEKVKYSCRLEKHKTDAGIEKVRIRITAVLK